MTTSGRTVPSKRGRGRPPTIDRERIVAAALAVAADDGAAAVTMSRVAERLGVVQPALYYHVRNVNDLLGLVAAELIARMPVPSARLRWDRWMHDFGWQLYTLLRDEPLLSRVPYLSAHTPFPAWVTERALRVLTRAGFPGPIAMLVNSQHIRIVVDLAYADYARAEEVLNGRTPLGVLRDQANETPAAEIPTLRAALDEVAWVSDDMEGFSDALFEWQIGLEIVALRALLADTSIVPLPMSRRRR